MFTNISENFTLKVYYVLLLKCLIYKKYGRNGSKRTLKMQDWNLRN